MQPAANGNSPNNLDWQSLYTSLVRDLGLDAGAFQLVYPYTSWVWPTSPPGFTSAAQYNFCATIPQWSLSGLYASSGARFDQGYGNFLSVLAAFSSDPALEGRIDQQQQAVQLAKNDYDQVYAQAAAEYEAATGGSNQPVFTVWLTTAEGRVWEEPLKDAWASYQKEYEVLMDLVAQSETPGLTSAQAALSDLSYYTYFQDPALSTFPQVPGFDLELSAAEWVAQVQAGQGKPGTVHLRLPVTGGTVPGAALAALPERPWTDRWIPVEYPFFTGPGTHLSRGPNDIQEITLHFEAWDVVEITPLPWYLDGFPCARENGPFIRGYSGYDNGSDTYLWGEGGALPLRKTAILVAYNPTFESATDTESLFAGPDRDGRVGPFLGRWIDGSAPVAKDDLTTSLLVPMIFGVYVQRLPCGTVAQASSSPSYSPSP